MQVNLKLIHEAWPGDRWQAFYNRARPLYERWFLSEGSDARPSAQVSAAQIREHVPQLSEVFETLVELAGGDALSTRFLSMWCPPPYMAGCSVMAHLHGNPTLVRNYDFDPRFFDGRLTFTEYCKPVIGMQDSGWGLLDGINGDGLSVALAFGGRRATGVGFGIPLLLRYVLETCSNTAQATAALSRVPVHMSYNVTVLDASGAYATVFLNPDRAPEVLLRSITTNHQYQVEWDEHAAFTRTLARLHLLEAFAADPGMSREDVVQRMLKPPLRSKQFLRGFGTLYTSAYDTVAGTMKVAWPDRRIEVGFDNFEEQNVDVVLFRPAGRYMAK